MSARHSVRRGISCILLLIVLIASFLSGSLPAAHADEWYPIQPPPSVSADGNTLYNGVPPLIIRADPRPEGQNIWVPQSAETKAAIADPDKVAASFSITYVAAGGTDAWGEPCYDFPAAAKTAFNAGAAIWAAKLQSSVPITIKACWADLGGGGILGYSGGAYSYRNFPGAPKSNVWYESSLANALSGSDLGVGIYDDNITYNKYFTWYYGTDGQPTAGLYDLMSVAAHEIGHGLNISGTANYSGGSGSLGSGGSVNIYDYFMETGAGVKLSSMASPSAALGSALTGGDVWFNAPLSKAANAGNRVRIFAPSSWMSGSSYSHLDYTTFQSTTDNLMVYAIGSGTARHNVGPVTTGLMKDMGWVTGASTVPTPMTPSGVTSDTTPQYTWSKITGATQYRYQLYNGTTPVYTKLITAPVCTTTTCSNTPANVLPYASTYKWHVQALVGGVWKAYSVFKNFSITNVPTPVAPSGAGSVTTPTFTWTRINLATQYQFAVYKGTTTTLAYPIQTVLTGNCGTSAVNCSNKPANVLPAASYTWRVRAMVGGAWKAWSAAKAFSISAASGPFNSQFTTDAAGWTPLNGSWSVSGGSYRTAGIAGSNFVSSKHSGSYGVLTYTARVLRTGCVYCNNGIYFNGTPAPLGTGGRWNKGYAVWFSNDGYYTVGMYSGGVWTAIQPWVYSSAVTSGWNIVKVTYNSSNGFVQVFMNGTRLGFGTFTNFKSGQVGLAMLKDTAMAGDIMYVDYATLATSAPTADVASDAMMWSDAMAASQTISPDMR